MKEETAGWATLLARLLLGAVFLYASFDKIADPGAFAKAVYNYQILPDSAVNIVAVTLPWVELLLGVCLIAGFWLPGATILSTGLLILFVSAMAYNEVRGLDVHCGCFSAEPAGGPDGFPPLIRDSFFIVVSGFLTARVFFSRQMTLKRANR
jgi:uncharacterized membrane protein YphA (DoxX/SURF4 family)